jgi:hypothetical protein
MGIESRVRKPSKGAPSAHPAGIIEASHVTTTAGESSGALWVLYARARLIGIEHAVGES